MGRLEDRLANHPARQRIEALRGAMAELSEETVEAFDEHAPGTRERLPKALTFIEGALKAADPALASNAKLEAIDSSLLSVEQHLQSIPGSPGTASNIDPDIENAVDAATSLLVISGLMAELSDSVTEKLDSSLEASVRELTERTEALPEQVSAMEERLRAAEEARTTADQERETALDTKVSELETSIETEKQRLDTLVPQFEETFTSAQTERQEAFEEAQTELKSNTDAVVAELRDQFEATTTKLQEEASAALEDVESKRTEVERLYHVISETGTAGEFHKEADKQRKAANIWRFITVIFGCIAAGIAIYASLHDGDSANVGEAIVRVAATLAAGGVAAYAGRQSGRHREREEEAKRLELELVAFPTFIDSLDEDQQREVRKEFVQRAFRGRPADSGNQSIFRRSNTVGMASPEQTAELAAVVAREVMDRLRRDTPPAA